MCIGNTLLKTYEKNIRTMQVGNRPINVVQVLVENVKNQNIGLFKKMNNFCLYNSMHFSEHILSMINAVVQTRE
jgi:hypothetical protein